MTIGDCKAAGNEAQQYVWAGAIPLQIHLHDSEVTTLPPPTPALILASRLGYLPLLVPQIKPFFSSSLPPGVDTVWFDYKGLPLKWYIPTGVLFDLLCAEPERPWNITVHFRGYPGNLLIPCEGEESVKWSFINALKEAAYIINGNCKNIMNMSQSDQSELWLSVLNGQMEVYRGVSSKLKLDVAGDDFSLKLNSSSSKALQGIIDYNATAPTRTGRIPVRLYLRSIIEDIDDLEDSPIVDSWDKIAYINHPVEIYGNCFTLHDAIKALLPEFFAEKTSTDANLRVEEVGEERGSEETSSSRSPEETAEASNELTGSLSDNAEIKLVRIQGIEPKLEIPFAWIASNLIHPEHYLHICVYVKIREPINI
ncbi:autophagy protein 5 [Dorcoceras hygrometricum]|uniref:Autophagy protein 5 n=1 Tax=Dorcoceras hygrometricum TaxID=472368 RepID=A0A2Z7ASY2_9LAMI|nr:autophagy protein 5 [Dorcoceras hygrometricum]